MSSIMFPGVVMGVIKYMLALDLLLHFVFLSLCASAVEFW